MEKLTNITVWNRSRTYVKKDLFMDGDLVTGMSNNKLNTFLESYKHNPQDYVSVNMLPANMFEEPKDFIAKECQDDTAQ